MHEGTFYAAVADRGEPGSTLRGRGSLELGPSGLRVRGRLINERLVMGLSIVIAIVTLVAVLVVVAIIEDASAGNDISGRFGAVLGIVGLAVGYGGGRMLVEAVLPGSPVDHVLTLGQIASARLDGTVLTFVSRDSACPGSIAFTSPTIATLAAELDRARNGVG